MNEGCLAVVVSDFTAQLPSELSVRVGDVVRVRRLVDEVPLSLRDIY